jgi:5-(carboxyamino)imidazole ribonucleotide synthase
MVFNPLYNLVDYLLSPAHMTQEQSETTQQLALKVVHALESPGLFAVEMFLDIEGKIWVNETAPRAHNSGHQSIEGNYCSQYDMQMRILQNLPLGSPASTQPSLMLNLIGEKGYSGNAYYEGLENILSIPWVYVHLYGKQETKPGRKMGHITILGNNRIELLEKAAIIKQHIKVKA